MATLQEKKANCTEINNSLGKEDHVPNAHEDAKTNLGAEVLCVSVPEENFLKIEFTDGTFTFHAQWLHDARNDRNPSRAAEDAFTVHAADARIIGATHSNQSLMSRVEVDWADGSNTKFPCAWLRIFAPMVAQADLSWTGVDALPRQKGWMVDTLEIPEVDWSFIFPQKEPTDEQRDAISVKIKDMMLYEGRSGIIKIVNVPSPDIASEKDRKNTLVTKVLKQFYGQVFAHPRRGQDETFNVSDEYGKDKLRGAELHNYRLDHILLPHCDHAHYDVRAFSVFIRRI
jgi:trimethyllysine dioxygenase